MKTHVAIVGGGFCGSLIAVHLLRGTPRPQEISIFEQGGRFGPGRAYGTQSPVHLLNVPAGLMSALPERPDDFLAYARERGIAARADDYLPRYVYGAYLEHLLGSAMAEAPQTRVHLRAVAVTDLAAGPEGTWELAGGEDTARAAHDAVRATHAVLAVGSPAARTALPGLDAGATGYVADRWAAPRLPAIEPDATVLLVGSGLTTVDVVLELVAGGHRGALVAISRHGWLPQAHAGRERRDGPELLFAQAGRAEAGPEFTSVKQLFRAVRSAAEGAVRRGATWQAVFDALRAQTPQLWQRLGERERGRFLAHVQPIWNAHRHRMAPEVETRLRRVRDSGQLRVLAGRVDGVRQVASGFDVALRRRGTAGLESLRCEWIINCTGADLDLRDAPEVLVRNLLARGLLAPDPLGQGLRRDWPARTAAQRLYWAGAWRRAELCETTAVPELRGQAAEVAAAIRADLGGGAGSRRGVAS